MVCEVEVDVAGFLTAARAEGGAPPTGVRTDLVREGVADAVALGVVWTVGREGLREGVVLGGFIEGRGAACGLDGVDMALSRKLSAQLVDVQGSECHRARKPTVGHQGRYVG